MRMFVPVKLNKESRNGTDVRMRRESHRFGGERLPSGYKGAAIDRENDAKRLARNRNRWLDQVVADGIDDWRTGIDWRFTPKPAVSTSEIVVRKTGMVVSCGAIDMFDEERGFNGDLPENRTFVLIEQASRHDDVLPTFSSTPKEEGGARQHLTVAKARRLIEDAIILANRSRY